MDQNTNQNKNQNNTNPDLMSTSLAQSDPELLDLINQEYLRQASGLELIASENFTSQAVLDTLGTVLTNKYSEGTVGARYYGGNEIIDQVESLCQRRALQTYRLDPNEWHVNVQPYSGSTANWCVYVGLVPAIDPETGEQGRVMGLDLPSGGHLTHGYQTAKKKISATSVYYQTRPYKTCVETGLIDYDGLAQNAAEFKPHMIICGASAYPRDFDYARFRQIADSVGAYLMCDMAHISGLVAAQECNNPFEFCDVVTTTTHKTLRGPRSGMIFCKKDPDPSKDLSRKIDFAVFPSVQGGPHQNTIAAVATTLKQANTPEFRAYIRQLKLNAKTLAQKLVELGYTLQTGGTDNHLILWNLRPQGITGSKAEKVMEACGISVNKNSILGDKSAISPGGIRLGSSALTSRNMNQSEFLKIAMFLDRAIKITISIQASHGKMLKNFVKGIAEDPEGQIADLRGEIREFALKYPLPRGM